ncbi:hypothetical protein HG264_11345 [Pseudomonas sp. gcc21]|uniref:hypothetical protein n=1 Tax=Pseudomonas sp. gcc21 TaxID=2726989 RepID=UPI001452A520|nr:hypothetical protein [Pseudomonas sp. gcc21]QJD59458.1 hypothetical protein HG264_11345 [Pseudomonas sp. gcc21]
MNMIRLLAYGVVLGLSVSGCGNGGADQSVLGDEAEQAELSALNDSTVGFDSLASTQNIDASFASTDGASIRPPDAVAEPITTVETRLAEPAIPEAGQNIAVEPIKPEDEAIVRDALYTLGEDRCTAEAESKVECPAKPEPGDQIKF